MIRLLLIDDFEPDRAIEKIFLEQAFYEVEITTLDHPPEPLDKVFEYDGLVIDERLAAGVSGVRTAEQIHFMNWRFPMMLVSGSSGVDTLAAMRYIDQVARKNDQRDIIMKATAFIRCIARVKQ